MYRARFQIWGILLCIVAIIFGIIKFIGWITEEPIRYTMYCMSDDNTFKSNISDIDKDYTFTLYDSKENVDYIIQPASDEIIPGYTKYSNYIYTPMVIWARTEATDVDYGFTVLNENSSSSTVYKDLEIILEAIEDEKTFEDIGINKKVAKDKVKLYIPNKNSTYYPYVENLFYITLNNGKVPTEEEREELKTRVNSLLKKCSKVEDVGQKILSLYSKNNDDYTLFIGPEALCARDVYAFNTTNNSAWVNVYPNWTCSYNYDLFVKTENKEELIKILKDSEFSDKTGYRIYDTGNFSEYHNHTVDNVTIAK